MGVKSWMSDSWRRIRSDGFNGLVKSTQPIKYRAISAANGFYSDGSSIYDFDWDLLVILDACRLDLLKEVESEYDWIESVNQIRSVNSATKPWMQDTFIEEQQEEMEATGYVCGNPFSKSVLNKSKFGALVELWQSAWRDPGTVPPEAVTDETIRMIREDSHERIIAHYMQPHCPFITRSDLIQRKELENFGDQDWRDIWQKLQDGDVDEEDVWTGYKENLQLGLNEVERLLKNVDADKVVVTSDHGNAKGEWTVYGHPGGMPIDCLRTVPWVETTASNIQNEQPEDWLSEQTKTNREEQLVALGYK